MIITKDILLEKLNEGSVKLAIEYFNISRSHMYRIMRKFDLPSGNYFRRNHNFVDHNFFKRIDNEHKAYWLGFLMADGCIIEKPYPHLSVNLAIKDSNHLVKLAKCLNYHRNLFISNRNSITLSINSEILCNDLRKLGCVPRKSLILEFPEIDNLLMHHFVRGYFDGDGSVLKNGQQVRVTYIGTFNFINKLKEILQKTSKLIPNGKVYVLTVSGNIQSYNLYKWMYNNATIYLDRKLDRFKQYFGDK